MREFISKYLGWRNWAVLYYNSIFENIFVFFYIAFSKENFTSHFFISIIFFLLLSVLSTTYGYLINDYADRELDKAHGKANTFENDSNAKALGITVGFLGLALFSAFPFWSNPWFWIVWLGWLLITSLYSLPPIRLKERGRIGLAFVILAQRVLPVLLVFVSFRFYDLPDVLLIIVYILLRGATSDMNHQLEDYENDVSTNTRTSAVEIGKERYQKLFINTLKLERLALFLLLLTMALQFKNVLFREWPVFWLPLLFFIVLWLASVWQTKGDKTGQWELAKINPYHPDKNIYQIIHLVFPNLFLSGFLLFFLLLRNPLYAFFGLFFIVIYRLYDINTLKNSFLKKWIT